MAGMAAVAAASTKVHVEDYSQIVSVNPAYTNKEMHLLYQLYDWFTLK